MSMTSPKTNLTSGQCAPLRYRPSPALHSTLPQHASDFNAQVFLRGDLRPGAEYTPNHSLNRTHCGVRQKALHFILGF